MSSIHRPARTFFRILMPFALATAAAAQTPAPSPEAAPAPARVPTVVIDGTTIAFDQPPISEAGRIYVPLRGVFERLGASVAFANGQINATAGRHTIGLHVGDTNAVIDGTPRVLESAPIVTAGRVLVPLRFVAEALGATVNFDPVSQTAYINRGAPSVAVATEAPVLPPAVTPPPPPQPILPSGVPTDVPPPSAHLLRVIPASGSTIARKRPEISATFPEPIDPQHLSVRVDGTDVTSSSFISERSFSYDPAADLAPGQHTVVISGSSPDRGTFVTRWTFTTGSSSGTNFVSGLEPPEGYTVKAPLLISGITRPNARVRITGTTSDSADGFNTNDEGTTEITVTADAHGYFEAQLDFVDAGTGLLDVQVESTAPSGIAVKTLRLRI